MHSLKPYLWIVLLALTAAACTPKSVGETALEKPPGVVSSIHEKHDFENRVDVSNREDEENTSHDNGDERVKPDVALPMPEPKYDLTPKVFLRSDAADTAILKLPQGWVYDGVMRLKEAPEIKNTFWIAPDHVAPDGVLRAVMKMGKNVDGSLMYRASFPENPAAVDGYSVTFERRSVLIHRWEGGFAAPVTLPVKVDRWPELVEIVVRMRGAHAEIDVLDAKSKKILAQLVSDDAALCGDQVGYRIYRKQDHVTGLVDLSFEPAQEMASFPKLDHPDAYIRQHPAMYVMAPQDKVKTTPALAACSPVKHDDLIQGYDVLRCSNEAMMQLMTDPRERTLPEGFFWTEPRAAFTDSEYRKTVVDMKCRKPMHCRPDQPLDPNRSAKDVGMTQAYLNAYVDVCKKRYRHVRLETIGRTYLGHEMRALVISDAKDRSQPLPRVLFNGAHHGIELLATDMAFDVIEQLCETPDAVAQQRYASVLDHVEVWVIPTVNLDGNDMFMHVSNHLGRKNGRGVFLRSASLDRSYPRLVGDTTFQSGFYRYRPNDIAVGAGVDMNRNYPLEWGATGEKSSSSRPRDYWYRGTSPGSEPEVQAMMNLFHGQQFASSISFHTVATKILSPYSIDALQNPAHEVDNAWQLALKMAQAAGEQVNGKPYTVVKNLYSVDGTDQDWFRMMFGTYAYVLEGPMHNPTGDDRRKALVRNRPAWETFLEASVRSTVVRVRDTSGEPLIAEVQYSDIPRLNGEHWLTRCQDGTHSLLCFGKRKITVTLVDGSQQTKTVDCRDDKPTIVDFMFEKPLQYSTERATIESGVRGDLFGIDAICDMKNNTCPVLPAHRYCLIDGACIPSGKEQILSDGTKVKCEPHENNHAWTFL